MPLASGRGGTTSGRRQRPEGPRICCRLNFGVLTFSSNLNTGAVLVLPGLRGLAPQHYQQGGVVVLQGAHLALVMMYCQVGSLTSCSEQIATSLASPSHVPMPGNFSRVRVWSEFIVIQPNVSRSTLVLCPCLEQTQTRMLLELQVTVQAKE